MIVDLENEDDFNNALKDSGIRPLFLLKHSTACPISAGAWIDFQDFAKESDDALFRRVLVRENKLLSGVIAEKTGISHQSPQIILFRDSQPVWHAAHYDITKAAMKTALDIRG